MNTDHQHYMTRFLASASLLVATMASSLASAAPTNDVFFGFSGPETFPIDPFISDLRTADIDGDGLTDIIIVNNSRSKINILYNQTGKTNLALAAKSTKP